jgi:hypothetical protein
MNEMIEKIERIVTTDNTGYTAHFVCPNRLTPTSYSPRTLGEIQMMKEVFEKCPIKM